ncbi:MAG: ATP-binding cassette domain-containing protein [Candidatus Syntropharchaeia archaeon]
MRGLKKVYGNFVAVDGISFEVKRGEVFGIVGPNGAGKTTILRWIRHREGWNQREKDNRIRTRGISAL